MKKILVLGGTRFFGKNFVNLLISKNYDVTIANRGQTPDSFGNQVSRIIVDRTNETSMKTAFEQTSWDFVIDQICYCPNDAKIACDVFNGKVQKYIFTSTQSVYDKNGNQNERDFDPLNYKIKIGDKSDFDYAEGKRQAEAVFYQNAKFKIVAMRIPIVLGEEDYTGRLEFHIKKVLNNSPIVIPNLNAKISFINSSEVARFMLWLIESERTKTLSEPINACSYSNVSISQIMTLIKVYTCITPIIHSSGDKNDCTPFAGEHSRLLDNTKAQNLGFEFSHIETWLPKLIEATVLKLKVHK